MNFTKKTTLLLLTIITFTSTTSVQAKKSEIENGYISYEKLWDPAKKGLNKKKKKSNAKPQKFTADDAFGGNNALGAYNSKDRIATVVNGDTFYTFKITEVSRNNVLPVNADEFNTVIIGSFTNIDPKKPEMPVTLYLLGTLETTIRKKPAAPITPVESNERSNAPETLPTTPMGSNKNSYAPVTFNPARNFSGDGLIGNYFSNAQSATIHDPTGVNSVNYSFEQVQENDVNAEQLGLVKIGSYSPPARCQNGICSHARRLIELYGKNSDGSNLKE